eukprot:1704244-Prymnesium_polylepis.2
MFIGRDSSAARVSIYARALLGWVGSDGYDTKCIPQRLCYVDSVQTGLHGLLRSLACAARR